MSLQKGKPNSQQILQTVQQRGTQQIQIPPRGTPPNTAEEYIQRGMYPGQQLRSAVHPQSMPANNNPHDMNKQHTAQSGMPGTSNAAVMYGTQMAPPFYPRQPPPQRAQVPTVNQRPSMNMGMNPATASQQQQSYYSQPPPPQQMIPIQQINTMQHVYMAGGGGANFRLPYAQQPYQVPSQTQTMYVSTANTPFTTYGTNPPMYFSQMMPRHQVPAMPSTQHNQLPKREKKLIRIQDPATSRDLTEEIVGHKIDASESRTSDVAAQFATQVAGVLGHQQQSIKEPVTKLQAQQIQMQQAHIPVSSTRSVMTIEKTIETNEPKTDLSNPNGTSAQVKLMETSSTEIETPALNIRIQNVVNPMNQPAFAEKPDEGAILSDRTPEMTSESVESPKLPPPTIPTTEVIPAARVEPSPLVMKQTSNFVATESAETSANDDSSPHENGDVAASETSDQQTEKEKWEPETKDVKKQKSKKKNLNRKGESKEGNDMDAFIGKDEITVPMGSPTVPEVTSNADDLSSKEEQRKVAEKNEENTKVSQDFERNENVISVIDTPVTKPVPKYSYKEDSLTDQWSPLNPEGKRQYDRAFLLKMQTQPVCLRKPEGLPDLEVIKDTVREITVWANKTKPFENRPTSLSGLPRGVSNVPDFIPGYVKSSTPRNVRVAQTPGTAVRVVDTPINRRLSQQGNKTEPKNKRSIVLSFNQDVKLNKAENAWKPTHKGGKDDTETIKTEDLYKRVRGILNKLTPQKFQTLLNQVNDLSIDTEDRLKGVIDLVFEKALDEPNFSVAYANLCKCLAMKRVPVGDNDTDFVNFRKLLLNKCQKEFEKDITDEVARVKRAKDIETGEADENKRREYEEELKELERKAKRRSLGNIRFIGELFKLHMLTASIMHDCLKKLLSQEDEDSLECLCRLLTTIGKDMDSEKGKATKESDNRMDSYFRQMQEIVKKRQTSSRVRFMLQDVAELRSSNWVPRRDENNPKTLDQIHLEAEREAYEREIQLSQPPAQHRRMDDKRKRSGVGGGGSSSMGEDGWNTVGSKNSSRIDPQKLKLSKVVVDDDIQLGPGGRNSVGWSRGSSGGSRTSSQEPENKSSVPTNRFQALAGDQSVTVDSRRGVNRNPPPSTRDSSKGRGNQMVSAAQRGNKTGVQSLKEREQAIAAVKTIAASAETGRAQVDSSRESSTTREEKKDPVLKGSPDLSEDDISTRAKPILDEFLHNTDFQEAILCISELCAPATIHFFVTTALNCVLERSAQTRQLIGQLMHDLVKTKVMTTEQYIKGLQAILSLAEDYAIDIPHIWEYLGELIAPLSKDGTIPLSFLPEAAQPCLETGCAGNFVSAVLHAVAKKVGTHEVGELWRSSNLQWSQFLLPSTNIQEFIAENKLEFTIKAREPCTNTNLSPEELKEALTALLASKQSENEEIFDWIDAHLNESQCRESSFVRALMIAVCQSVLEKNEVSFTVDEVLFRSRCSILKKYLDHSEACEINALYALQALMHQLEHPKDVLYSIFGFLYDEEVISEDAFLQWEASVDPAEQEGKGVALNSVRSFYVWLKEAENESVEES